LQGPEDADRQGVDYDVCYDVDDCVGVVEGDDVDTGTGGIWDPELGDGATLECGGTDAADAESGGNEDHDVDEGAEDLIGTEAEVEEEEGHLDEHYCYAIGS